ncbi:IS30 family transposase [Luteipulveratus flavus]|uniref:IS30 family transposase n=1 Tax=Luteipulveratus flavus TaxID=3031728 RepID=A0ABT6C7L9_9MICO|nr:IS30 family transposase [Luteipulveratus sp. YIM 133296]MDF8264933.1 IS30 family transposase [Luteipulveratus sp. YIM 133296]
MPGKRLSLSERAQIEVLFGQDLTFPQIAAVIGRDRSTVWREVRRNNSYRGARMGGSGARSPSGRHAVGTGRRGGCYRWVYEHRTAQHKYRVRARRCHGGKLRPPWGGPLPPLWHTVAGLLGQQWSPQQVAHWLRAQYPSRPEMWVSHETIYQAIYIQGRGSLRAELGRQVALRSGRTVRKPQSRTGAAATRSRKPWIEGLHISTRPAEVADRAVPGHWEGDLVIGARGSSAVVTLVERSTGYVMLGALPQSRVSEQVITVLTRLMGRLPAHLARSLTWDQGPEMAEHARFTLATGCQVFFCDPHSPWQRGSNENTNGLLRQYFPRTSTNFRTYTQDDLDRVAIQLNGRPRQRHHWQTPAEKLNELLVATAP